MPNLLTRLARAAGYAPSSRAASPSQKSAPLSGMGVAFYGEGRAVWTPRDYGALAREGFQRNAVVHRAVRLVAEAAASLPLTLMDAAEPHPLTALLARPNPREGGARLMETLYGHLMVSGNAALWSKCTKGAEAFLTLGQGVHPNKSSWLGLTVSIRIFIAASDTPKILASIPG